MAASSSSTAKGASGRPEPAPGKKDHNKYRKEKPWDHDGIDHWTVPEWTGDMMKHSLVEESSFATLFPQYREKYLREVWPAVTKALEVSMERRERVSRAIGHASLA